MASDFLNCVEFSSSCRYFTWQKYAVGYQSRVSFVDWRGEAMVKVWCTYLFMRKTQFQFPAPNMVALIRPYFRFQGSIIFWPPGNYIHEVHSQAHTQSTHTQNNKIKFKKRVPCVYYFFKVDFLLLQHFSPHLQLVKCRVTTLRRTTVRRNKPLRRAPGIHSKIHSSQNTKAFSSKKKKNLQRLNGIPSTSGIFNHTKCSSLR